MSSHQDEVFAWIAVGGFECPVEAITRIIGIQPSRTRQRGETFRHPKGVRDVVWRESSWTLHSPLAGSVELEAQVDALLELIAPAIPSFRKLPTEASIHLGCAIYAYSERPAIWFTRKQIECLASIGAGIDVDVYDFTECEDDKQV